MKPLPRKLLLSSAGCVLVAAATLTLPACTDTSYVSSSTSSSSYYRVGGRYYHCHRGGVCHNMRHPDYYWRGGVYRPRPPQVYYQTPYRYQRPATLPARPRPR